MIKQLVLVIALSISCNLFAKDNAHFDAAMRTVNLSLGNQVGEIIDTMVSGQISANPLLKSFAPAFKAFYKEVLFSDDFKKQAAKINMDLFTLEELKELETMMLLPIFNKQQQRLPEYLSKFRDLAQQGVLANQNRLRELIEIERKKLPTTEAPQRPQPQFSLKSSAYTDESNCPNYPFETLVGTWLGKREDSKTGETTEWKNIRLKNGKYSIEFSTFSNDGSIKRFNEEGLWSYSGCLYSVIVQKVDSQPALYQEVYRIHEINESMMRYSNYRSGGEYTLNKAK